MNKTNQEKLNTDKITVVNNQLPDSINSMSGIKNCFQSTKETFSTPSTGFRDEKVSVYSVDECNSANSHASSVTDVFLSGTLLAGPQPQKIGKKMKNRFKHGAIALQTRYVLEKYIKHIKELFGDVIEQNITNNEKVEYGRKYDK
jgi:hypothetical protein